MKIGTLLNLELKQDQTGEVLKYRCKVVEKNEDYLYIDYPIEIKTNKTAFLHKGSRLSVEYVGKDQSVYKFHTEIIARVKLNVPALIIDFPRKDNIKRIQRREYVRIETAIDIAFHGSKDSFTTVTSDISGGGLSIIVPNGKTIVEKEEASVWIVLQMHSGEFQYVTALTEVIRVKESESTASIASLKFISVTKPVRQNIVRYCFEKQREARKKELL
ncbi:flagellar brake protein [Virgibacillus salinus]|uniref:C-di-GMP-binding flagellar brake protein YcgR, contains PilZNR and PilZ domains n=1 Tax=Virgibacillus salinus TaxID=553311 RepID=A0A1H1BQB1_9BACI|nr:flagellar brake domain-containing protein [Virgibacillus salinus]SDQ54079.1 c-di-GMP-binding flagellar brake protein YcgR, contains PilZNR and PilZ domains [Virgibacillus salinus]